jgi:uncharacterized protein with von Willebrand factor type A (vWA) domain
MISRLGSMSANIIRFCRFLRTKGFVIGVEEETIALKAVQHIDIGRPDDFFLALKTTLCRNKKQLDNFDELYGSYWKETSKAEDSKKKEDGSHNKSIPNATEQFKSLNAWLHGNQNSETEETATYSRLEGLSRKDFSTITGEEIDELMQYLKSLSRHLAARMNRRYEKSRLQNLPDLRQTLRKNLRRGGELMDIVYRQAKKKRVKTVILCDVSQSMELYTVFLLQFMYAFQQVFTRVETFTFSTSLNRMTSYMKENNFSETIDLLKKENIGWNGGTRIGESLDEFVREYAEKLLDRKTIVIILSDGWDTGDIDMLERNMENIHGRVAKLIWLNPLAGYSDYRPLVAGMKAALPFIDIFASAHNAASLRQLGKSLAI